MVSLEGLRVREHGTSASTVSNVRASNAATDLALLFRCR